MFVCKMYEFDSSNGWEPADYMSYNNQKFRLFHESNLSVLSIRICLLVYPGSA